MRHPHYVVWRQYDSKFHAPSGGADWVPELRFPGYELNDDDLQRVFAADPVAGQRSPHRPGAGRAAGVFLAGTAGRPGARRQRGF